MTQEDMTPPIGVEAKPAAPTEPAPVEAGVPIRRKASGSPFLTKGNLVLLAMYAAGIAGVYGLSLRNGPSAALADQNLMHAKVEAALNIMGAQPSATEVEHRRSAKAIVSEFYTAAKQRQVDAKDLKGNLFVFREPATAPVEAVQAVVENKPKPPDEAEQALQAVKTLKLQSVLVGRETTAMISYNLVTEGQTIKGWTVTRISAREVELSWKDKTYMLLMPK